MNNKFPRGNDNAKYTITKQSDGNGSCTGPSSAEMYTNVTFRASPYTGYKFSKFELKSASSGTVVRTSTSTPWTTQMPAYNIIVKAYFTKIPKEYTLTLKASPSSGGTVSGGGTYTEGTQVTISASAKSGYKFTKWSDGSTASTRSIVITGNKTLTAYFEEKTKYNVYLGVDPSGAGSVSGAGQYYAGSIARISATANTGYEFDHWTDGDTHASRNITVNSTISLVAYFRTKTFDVSVEASPSGGGTVSGGGTSLPYGQRTAVIATPNTEAHYHFNYWRRSDGETYDNARWDFSVTDDFTCTAYFSLDSYQVYLGVDPSGAGSVSGDGEYTWGSVAHIVATANEGYRFVRWTDGNTEADRYINVYSTTTLVAYFEVIPQKFTFNVNPSGIGDFGVWENGGSGLPLKEKIITKGETFSVEARDSLIYGYRFKNWDNAPALNYRIRSFEWTGSYDRNYTAYYEYVGTVKVTLVYHGQHTQPGYGEVIKATTIDGSRLICPPYPENQTVVQGAYLTFKATALPGFIFDHWDLNGINISSEAEYTHLITGVEGALFTFKPMFRTASPTEFYSIKIKSNKYPTGEGIRYYGDVELLKPGETEWEIIPLEDTPYTNLQVPEGTWVQIHHADGIYVNGEWFYFTAWSDAEPDNIYGEPGREWLSLQEDIDLTMNYGEAKKVTCISQPETGGYFSLKIAGESGLGQTGYDFIVGKDRQVDITAIAYPGYDFVRWEDTGSTDAIRRETITEDTEFFAVFRDNGGAKKQYHLTADIVPTDGGSVLGTGWYDAGTTITIFALSNPGFRFDKWNDGSTHYSKEIRMTKDFRFTAYFKGAEPPIPVKDITTILLTLFRRKKNKNVKFNL